MIIGTKCDLERKVTYEEGKKFADSIGVPYMEVSSLTGYNVNEAFIKMAEMITEMIAENAHKIKVQKEIIAKNLKIQDQKEMITKMISSITELTECQFDSLLFDSEIDNWNNGDSTLTNRIIGKSNIFLFIDDGINQFGYYIKSQINEIDKFINDSNSFLFSFNKQEKYPITNPKYAIQFHSPNQVNMITIGNGDISLKRKEEKEKCTYKQTSFDYGNSKSSLISIFNRKEIFTLKQLVIFQMIETP